MEQNSGLAHYLQRPKSVIPPLVAFLVFLLGVGGFVALLQFLPLWGEAAKSKEALALNPWLKFAARFHVLVIHLPLGILGLVVFMEILSVSRQLRDRLIDGIFAGLWLAGLSGIAGVVLGWLLTADTGRGGDLMLRSHLYWTVAAVLGILLATFFRHVNERAASTLYLRIYQIILLGVLGAISIGGHEGANLVHGPTYLTRNMPPELEKWTPAFIKPKEAQKNPVDQGQKTESKQPEPDSSPQNTPSTSRTEGETAASKTVFLSLILPILEEKCNECHNEDKTKGRLRMDRHDLLLAGGAEENSTVIPGDPENSLLIVRATLPEDDDEKMPPDNMTPLSEKEIAVISWWIKHGASEKITVAEARNQADFPQL